MAFQSANFISLAHVFKMMRVMYTQQQQEDTCMYIRLLIARCYIYIYITYTIISNYILYFVYMIYPYIFNLSNLMKISKQNVVTLCN